MRLQIAAKFADVFKLNPCEMYKKIDRENKSTGIVKQNKSTEKNL